VTGRIEDLARHYRDRFIAHGDDPLAAQMSREGQRFRFLKLFEIADLSACSVLDLGSGLGDMYPYLRERFPTARYEGIDIVPEMVAHASAKYPEVRFRAVDLLSQTVPERYDYVLLSVVFNNAIADPTGFLERLVTRAFSLCTRGLGFNFLSTRVNFSEPSMAYHDPARVLDYCLESLSRKVVLHHHYERCDVAVFVYR
jgi:SAM-dependent methyltransferase